MITQDLGIATAYGYAKSKGYTGTEAEFAELMASYASTAQTAIEAADRAVEANTAAQSAKTDAQASKTAAQTAAQTATSKASEAVTAADTATTKASEASTSADTASAAATSASTSAQTATAKAGTATAKADEASVSANMATTAKTDAEAARDAAAQSASEAAESARTLTIDATLTQAGQAADAKVVGDNLDGISADGIMHLDKSFTWLNAWVNTSGKIQASSASKTALVTLQAGETIIVGTNNTNVCIIGFTDNDAIAINDVITVIQTTSNNERFETYSYTAIDTINIVFCIRYSNYTLDFTKSTNLAKLFESVGDVDALETTKKDNVVDAVNEVNGKTDSVQAFLDNIIIHNPQSNYINKTEYSNGYINSSGEFVSNSDWRATGFCELTQNTQYYSDGLYGGYCAFYKADKSVITAYGASAFNVASFITPPETAYGRFSLNTLSPVQGVERSWIYTLNEKPKDYALIFNGVGISEEGVTNPCDYEGNEISVFNKILCVGDSMTEGTFNHLDSGSTQWVTYPKYAYPAHLHKMTGVDVTSLGHGGKTAVQWYEIEQDSDLSGYDCAIVQLGINDYGTYGALGDETKTAFQNIISKLKTQNKNIKIFVANIIPATSYSTAGYKQFSADLLEWLETTYESDKDVIPVDIQQYGHTGSSPAYNCGHLSAFGYHRLAEDYKNYISWYISKNKEMFREVQFIGTDYWYTNPNT